MHKFSSQSKRNYESYRKYRMCPIAGCASSDRPIKKLSQHLQHVHKLSSEERVALTKKAKVVSRQDVVKYHLRGPSEKMSKVVKR